MNEQNNGLTDQPETRIRRHVVQAGETLSGIAQHHYGAENAHHWVELHDYNRAVIGENANILLPGSELLIPELDELIHHRPGVQTHVVQPGESLSSIARLYYGPEHAAHWITLYNHNRETIGESPDRLAAGMELVIPDLSQFL